MTLRERITDATVASLEEHEPRHLPSEFTLNVSPKWWVELFQTCGVAPIRVGRFTVHLSTNEQRLFVGPPAMTVQQ